MTPKNHEESRRTATVQGGSHGRWFEELCRIKHLRLREIAARSEAKLLPKILHDSGGVYAFWWTGDLELLRSSACNHDLVLKGPGGREVILRIDQEWLGLSTYLPVPLYVGKTASGIRKRVVQHLMLGKERILPLGGGAKKAKAPTTTCQLRAGIEHMFPSEKDTRVIVLDNIGFSFVALHGDYHAANRFYLEDMAIGLMRPPLNVDIER